MTKREMFQAKYIANFGEPPEWRGRNSRPVLELWFSFVDSANWKALSDALDHVKPPRDFRFPGLSEVQSIYRGYASLHRASVKQNDGGNGKKREAPATRKEVQRLITEMISGMKQEVKQC